MIQAEIVHVLSGYECVAIETFEDFHKRNPNVWKYFVLYAREMKRNGRRRYGAKSIMERVRWHFDSEKPQEEFKVNNNYTAMYARMLVAKDPAFKDFFEFRTVKGLTSARFGE